MPEFEVTIGKANALRSLIANQEGTLLPPKGLAALSSSDQTIQVLNGEPVVVTFSRYQSTNGRITPMMYIATSNGIAEQEWFSQIILGDSAMSSTNNSQSKVQPPINNSFFFDGLEPQGKKPEPSEDYIG